MHIYIYRGGASEAIDRNPNLETPVLVCLCSYLSDEQDLDLTIPGDVPLHCKPWGTPCSHG
jgi:hypothetical protein